MSDLLTHWAVFDDTRRLAASDPEIDRDLLVVLEEATDYARLGAIARAGGKWAPKLLWEAREAARGSGEKKMEVRRLAFGLGGILHFPADHVFKPLMGRLARTDWDRADALEQQQASVAGDLNHHNSAVSPIREISAYYDCHVFREVYLARGTGPFTEALLRTDSDSAARHLEEFLRASFQRSLLSSHTLAPDMENFDTWLDELLAKVQPLYISIALYARVFAHPDPEKLRAYEVETTFYNRNDPLIRLADSARRGETIAASALREACENNDSRTGYAECLRLGVQLLRDTSAYWRGETSELPDIHQGPRAVRPR